MDKHEAEGTSISINRGRAKHEGSLLQQAWTLWVMPINPQKKRLNIGRADLARLTDPNQSDLTDRTDTPAVAPRWHRTAADLNVVGDRQTLKTPDVVGDR